MALYMSFGCTVWLLQLWGMALFHFGVYSVTVRTLGNGYVLVFWVHSVAVTTQGDGCVLVAVFVWMGGG